MRHGDYRDITETGFDAVSSIGRLEHIGVRNYSSYFGFLQSRLRPGGLLLNHCITRPENRSEPSPRGFIDRYIFPDGELTGSGRIISEAKRSAGLGTRGAARGEPASPLRADAVRLVRQPRRALGRRVAEVGLPTAKVWGLYMEGSRLGCESNGIQLHQVLMTKPDERSNAGELPLRPWWTP